MGLCLSCRCGESHPKSSLLPLSTPQHPSPSSSPSLSTFLHLWTTETIDTTSETTNKLSQLCTLQAAPPVDDYSHLTIPHSSELFSLPSSDAGSTARSSTSSAALSWSMENPKPNFQITNQPTQPRGSNAARRKSCSSLGQQEVLPSEHWHKKSLADTIARLEKFCDAKFFLENRTSSQSWVVPRSNSDYDSTILVQESCRDFAQKLLWFANDHSGGMLSRYEGDAKCEVVATNKKIESETVSVGETSFRRDAENFHDETVPVVASFLRDAENFQSNLNAGETPVMSRLLSLRRFYDGEENIQFTDFEATFELLAAEMSALHCNVEADQASGASISSENVAPRLGVCQYAHRQSLTRSDFGGGWQCKGSHQQKGSKNPALLRSALSDISSNGTRPADEPPERNNHQPLKSQTSTGVLKRGGSRSLDLQNSSLSHLEFDKLLKTCERWQLLQGAAETLCRGEPQRVEAEECQRIEVADSATIEHVASEEEEEGGSAPSPSGDSAPSESQPTKGKVSVCGGGGVERFPESVCSGDANGGDEIPIVNDNSENSLSQASFDKLLEVPPGEFASEDASRLPEAATDTLEFSADGASATDCSSCENENWRHEAPASSGNTVQPELLALHEPADCLPETLPGALSVDVLVDPTLQFCNMKACI